MADQYQALYRRYRSKRFGDQVGQEHVMRALRTAVQEDRVGHAYLFSGPRGTGKTSTARILAKALNCEAPVDGEPCCACPNCVAVDEGRIVDWLLELDAASHNGVAAIRELIERIPLGTSGNRKVVILDEVHMLSTGASNALLKSLEEPPPHVVFVLATTDPQKVLPTIRSRTQHFEFHLLPADALADHVRHVIEDAGLGLGEDVVDHVIRQGGGSARDTLSALDQVAAMGGVPTEAQPVEAILQALVERDAGAALVAVAEAASSGRDPRALGETLIARLRDAFLSIMQAPDRHLPAADQQRAGELGALLGPARVTRALEVLGEALVELAKKPDPRIVLEVALVRLCRPEADHSLEAVVERLERLERRVAAGAGGEARPSAPAPHPGPPDDAMASPASAPAGEGHTPAPAGDSPAAQARAELARVQGAPPAGRPRQPVKKAAARPGPTAPRDDAGASPAPPASQEPEAAAEAAPAGSSPSRAQGGEPPSVEPPAAGDETGGPASMPSAGTAPSGGAVAPGSGRAQADAPTASSEPAGAPGEASDTAATEAAPGAEAGAPSPGPLDVSALTAAWPSILASFKPSMRAMYEDGEFTSASGGQVVLSLPGGSAVAGEQRRPDLEAALSQHFGTRIRLRLERRDDGSGGSDPAGAPRTGEDPSDDDVGDVHALEDAPTASTGVARLTEAFPGAELLEEP